MDPSASNQLLDLLSRHGAIKLGDLITRVVDVRSDRLFGQLAKLAADGDIEVAGDAFDFDRLKIKFLAQTGSVYDYDVARKAMFETLADEFPQIRDVVVQLTPKGLRRMLSRTL